jgi:methyl-accepting chemotaxis protein
MTRTKNKFSKSPALSRSPVPKKMGIKKTPPAPPIPPAPPVVMKKKQKETRNKKNIAKTVNLDDIKEYVKINEKHFKDLERGFSSFIRKDDLLDVNKKLKEDLDDIKDKVKKIEDRPFVPPLSVASSKGMGKITSRIDDLENVAKKLQEQVNRERRENIETNTRTLKTFDDISKNIKQLEETMKSADDTIKKHNERIENESNDIKRDTEEIGALKDAIDKMDIDDILRNIESIKMKNQWIEQNIEKIDIRLLYEKMEELEHKLEIMKVSSPYVIE